jgi:hypothetical protein
MNNSVKIPQLGNSRIAEEIIVGIGITATGILFEYGVSLLRRGEGRYIYLVLIAWIFISILSKTALNKYSGLGEATSIRSSQGRHRGLFFIVAVLAMGLLLFVSICLFERANFAVPPSHM